MSEKIFVGKGKLEQGKYGDSLALSFGPQDLEKIMANRNASGWVNMYVNESRQPDGRGNTHYCVMYARNPENGGAGNQHDTPPPARQEPPAQPAEQAPASEDDLPF